MTRPTIPAGLRPVVTGYGFDGPGGTMRTEVEGGMSRYAMDFDRGSQMFRVTFILTPLELSVWSAFYHQIIKKGSITFDMIVDSGFGPDTHAVNIVPGSYTANRTAGGVQTAVNFIVEAESQAYEMTPAEAQILVDLWNVYGKSTDAVLAGLDDLVNVKLLVLA